jgi:hypothetical protein
MRRIEVPGQPRQIVHETPSQQKKKQGMVSHACYPNNTGSRNRRIMIQVGLGKVRDPISKITRAKWAGGVAQVVEHLLHKHKPQYCRERERKRERERES